MEVINYMKVKVIKETPRKISIAKWLKCLLGYSPLLAIFFSGIALWRSCAHDQQVFNHKMKIDAVTHMPVLKSPNLFMCDSTRISNAQIKYPPPESLLLSAYTGYPVYDSIIWQGSFVFYGHLMLYNTGRDIAKLVYVISGASWRKDPLIRNVLLGNDDKKIDWIQKPSESFFDLVDIAPGDSHFFPITLQIDKAVDPNNVIIHICFLYENQTGALFDTYFLFKFEGAKIPQPEIFCELCDQKFRFGIVIPREKMNQLFQITESLCLYWVYDQKEKKRIFRMLEDK